MSNVKCAHMNLSMYDTYVITIDSITRVCMDGFSLVWIMDIVIISRRGDNVLIIGKGYMGMCICIYMYMYVYVYI